MCRQDRVYLRNIWHETAAGMGADKITQQVCLTYVRLPVFHGILALLSPVDLAVSLVRLVICETLLAFGHQTSVAGFAATRTISLDEKHGRA